jgi:hypothetical protein
MKVLATPNFAPTDVRDIIRMTEKIRIRHDNAKRSCESKII